MSDVVVHLAVNDSQSETKFAATVEAFARSRVSGSSAAIEAAPEIMVKTIRSGEIVRKAIIFQDRSAAAEFLALWRREKFQN